MYCKCQFYSMWPFNGHSLVVNGYDNFINNIIMAPNRRACIKMLMKVHKVYEVCQDRGVWSESLPTTNGKKNVIDDNDDYHHLHHH